MSFKSILFAAALSLSALPALAFGPQDFTAREVSVKNLIGRLDITVAAGADKVTASVTGPDNRVADVTVRQQGKQLVIEQSRPWRRADKVTREDWVDVKITVPAGTPLAVSGFIGEGNVGDLQAPLTIDSHTSGTFRAGHVTTAAIGISGSGDIRLGKVDNNLSAEIAGSGSVQTGETAGKVTADVRGSGKFTLDRVDGPMAIAIKGSGDVIVKSGTIDPLTVSIVGSGKVIIDGQVRSQSISRIGSGTVIINGRKG